jgi:preprotein translocase subunit SecA
MLQAEVAKRVDLGLADEEGPWKLIAWLEQVQPTFESADGLFPTYGLSLLLDELAKSDDFKSSALDIVKRAIETEEAHTLRAVDALVERSEESLDTQISEREDSVDTYFDGLRDLDEIPRPQKMVEELASLIHLPLKLNGETMRALADDPVDAKETIQDIVTSELTKLSATRLIGAIQNRVGEQLSLPNPLPYDWNELRGIIINAAHAGLESRRKRLASQVGHDIDVLLQRETAGDDSSKLRLLMSLSQGARAVFDQRTHKQVKQVFTRFTYIFLIAQLLDGREAPDVTENVLNHLEAAEEALRDAWGHGEFERLSQNAARVADFGQPAKILSKAEGFGEEWLNKTVADLGESEREALIESIGRFVLNEVHRHLLLSAFSELWVEYLTKVEALRVSIGLEAYAQRDPLVQYKGRASEMFQELLADVRGLVIGRAFAARPRRVAVTAIEVSDREARKASDEPVASEPPIDEQGAGMARQGAKRKRKRH